MIQHEMEIGVRPLPNGGFVPRLIPRRFESHRDGEIVLAVDLHPAISTNPFLSAGSNGRRSARCSGASAAA